MVETRLTEHAGVEYPIICGAMYPCSNPELVAAASEGGGIAIIQPVSLTMVHGYNKPDTKEGLRVAIRYIRTLTNKPLGFNALIEKGSEVVHVSWSILSIRSPENHAAGMDSAVKILNFIRPLNDLYSLSNFISLIGTFSPTIRSNHRL